MYVLDTSLGSISNTHNVYIVSDSLTSSYMSVAQLMLYHLIEIVQCAHVMILRPEGRL